MKGGGGEKQCMEEGREWGGGGGGVRGRKGKRDTSKMHNIRM